MSSDNSVDDIPPTNTGSTSADDDQKQQPKYKMDDMDDDLVIESDDDDDDDTVNLINQNLKIIPISIAKQKGPLATTLILSKNKLNSLKNLEQFASLTTLQLDRNGLKHINDLPKLNQLKTLWLNNNEIRNLNALLMILKKQASNIEYLSLLFNPICPTLDASTTQLHKRYRLTVIYHLPKVKFLDTEQVTLKERKEAIKRGKFLIVAKPAQDQLDQLVDVIDQDLNEDVSPYQNVQPAAFLGKGRIKYDGRESEGNRFILNQDL